MARSGINKKMVYQAIKQLTSANSAVTVDAVRAELGHTGSKTTICRFMNELEQEQAVQGDKLALLNDVLLALVSDVAKKMHDDLQSPLLDAQAQLTEKQKQWQEQYDQLLSAFDEEQSAKRLVQSDRDTLNNKLEKLNNQSVEGNLLQAKQNEVIQSLQQQVITQKKHIDSLEDKHNQARDALNHFRESAKEQREQENQRHANQVQLLQSELRQTQQSGVIKQEKLSRQDKAIAAFEVEIAYFEQGQKQTKDEFTTIANIKSKLDMELVMLKHTLSVITKDNQISESKLGNASEKVIVLEQQCKKLSTINTQLLGEVKTKDHLITQWMSNPKSV